MGEQLLSVGIDIGTSTTQLVFSRLVVENLAGNYAVPRISIVEKEVIYRSKIYFTPLRSPTEIDTEKVKEIVRGEYAAAGIRPEDLQTGDKVILSIYESQLSLLEKGAETIKADQVQLGTQRLN